MAGRLWAQGAPGGPADDEFARDLDFWGLPREAAGDPDGGEIWSEHLVAWHAWCAVSGQWRVVPVVGFESSRMIWQGLDYSAARAGFELAGIKMTPDLWDEVRTIEAGAAEELNRVR